MKELIEFIKSSISIIINIKLQEEIEKYVNTKFNPAIEYELLLQKEEQTNREHIGIEHQFKIQCEKYAQELDSLENEKSKYDVVVISEFLSPDEIIKINDICRNNQIGFIYTSQLGIYGFCFVDFGDNFTVIDENGSEPLKYCIKSIIKDKIVVVTFDTTERMT